MGGGLMQLVAYGAQDIYLTGNPQITFFKVVYRRHTNFSMESIRQQFSGGLNPGSQATATIARNGDLIHKMYYTFNPQTLIAGNCTLLGANVGHTLLDEIELEIGGQLIDKHFGHWLTVWDNLTNPNPFGLQATTTGTGAENEANANASTFANAIALASGIGTNYQRMSYNHVGVDPAGAGAVTTAAAPPHASVPLQFWFCRHPGLALPLIALQYHEVKVKITFCQQGDIMAGAGPLNFGSSQLWVDYIYLDTDERRRFAQQSHEYLIEQLQTDTMDNATNSKELEFNHPVKELIWTGQPKILGTAVATVAPVANLAQGTVHQSLSSGTPSCVIGGGHADLPNDTFQLKLNGHDRFAPRHPYYFTRLQVHDYHSGAGGVTVEDSIAVYSFALKPEEHQPSGTCNFSRIDNARFERVMPNAPIAGAGAAVNRRPALNFYAVNYNVLRIMSGMGGLAYSN